MSPRLPLLPARLSRFSVALSCALACALAVPAAAQTAPAAPTLPGMSASAPILPGDPRPDAPALSARGSFAVGVQTLRLAHPGQLDIVNAPKEGPIPTYTRPLTVEVWYPTAGASGQGRVTYQDAFSDGADKPARPFVFQGRATRLAPVLSDGRPDGGYPLVIISHGYPGSRYLLSYLAENLASKGYVVASIDHTDSTHGDQKAFASTLLNRPLDDNFVLDQLGRLAAAGSGSFLSGVVNTDNAALLGYSMGGYGALNALGAGFAPQIMPMVPGNALAVRQTGQYKVDPRFKAMVVFAPWGGDYAVKAIGVNFGAELGFWDKAGMAGLKVPSLFVVGDHDDVAGYQGGVKSLFENAVNSERYLLVYENARHNSAPNPPPAASLGRPGDYGHYAEAVWDSRRLNDLNMHFVTAFLDLKLKGMQDRAAYLDVKVPVAQDGKYSRNADGTPKADDTYWPGFMPRTALGIELYKMMPK